MANTTSFSAAVLTANTSQIAMRRDRKEKNFSPNCLAEVLSSDMDDKEAYTECMEDLLDLIAHHRAMDEHKKNLVTDTSEDVEQMLAGDSNGDLKQTLTKTPR